MNSLVSLKNETSDFQVEFDVIPLSEFMTPEQMKIQESIDAIDKRILDVQQKIDVLNTDIDRLTNHTDGVDYTIAVASGIIAGLIDSFFVGEWDFASAKAWSNEKVNRMVTDFAKKDPQYKEWLSRKRTDQTQDPDRLENAVKFLEEKFHLPGDSDWVTQKGLGISANSHRLDDMCHHPTPFGLLCCIIVQFSGHTMYCNSSGIWIKDIPVTVNEYGNFVGNSPISKLFSGIINWFITVAKTIANQKGHLMSDMATSAGIPGPFMSMLKELSTLPCFKDSNFGVTLNKAFTRGIGTGKNQIDIGVFNNLFSGASSKMDMRTGMAIGHELKRQAIPVIINEVIVRGAYFIRRLIMQLKEKGDLLALNWKELLPLNNRTIVRMMTIASGTFVAIDLGDAAIRSAIKSGGINAPAFAANFILHVNFVGVGRFAIAIGADITMGVQHSKKRDERINAYNELLFLNNAKVYYKQGQAFLALQEAAKKEAELWVALEENEQAMIQLINMFDQTINVYFDSYESIQNSIKSISNALEAAEKKNPGIKKELLKIL